MLENISSSLDSIANLNALRLESEGVFFTIRNGFEFNVNKTSYNNKDRYLLTAFDERGFVFKEKTYSSSAEAVNDFLEIVLMSVLSLYVKLQLTKTKNDLRYNIRNN